MKLSASQAAKETGLSIPTITRAIKSGKLSAHKLENGGYEIDPAELFRVYDRVTVKGNETPPMLEPETPNHNGVLEVQVQMLREMLAEVRTDRDAWKEQAERATRLLAAPVRQEAPRRSWWPFGRSNDETPPTASKIAKDG